MSMPGSTPALIEKTWGQGPDKVRGEQSESPPQISQYLQPMLQNTQPHVAATRRRRKCSATPTTKVVIAGQGFLARAATRGQPQRNMSWLTHLAAGHKIHDHHVTCVGFRIHCKRALVPRLFHVSSATRTTMTDQEQTSTVTLPRDPHVKTLRHTFATLWSLPRACHSPTHVLHLIYPSQVYYYYILPKVRLYSIGGSRPDIC